MGKPNQPRDKKGRWVSRGGGGLAVVLGIALAAGGGLGAGIGSAGGGTSVSSGSGARAQNGTSTRGKARDRSTARTVERLAAKGLRVRQQGIDAGTDCAAHACGQVRDFFRDHPCVALFRALLEVRDDRGAVVLVAVAWVDMPDEDQAVRLLELMDSPESGNVTELSRERGGQRFTGEHYRSAIEGTTVVNAQAEPVGRAAVAAELAELVVDAVTGS